MITITTNSPLEATREQVMALLNEHAASHGHRFEMEEVNLEARDGGEFLGGMIAKLGTEWAFIELLALSEAARGKGIGQQLIEQIETIARDKGKIGIWVDTHSFQAPDFYRKMGYTEFGKIDDYPKGESRHFFAKVL